MGFEGRKGKFEIEILAAARACERSRERMVEGIIFHGRISLCLVLVFVFLAVVYVLSTDVVVERKEKRKK